ncbi:MAG: VOC family protein [Planctomycetaceae bacterium]|nr:VOC family protein [Planctomycetales bacterium]MCB9924003.1 VOC family protein [Planctomycetaceae bacterium]
MAHSLDVLETCLYVDDLVAAERFYTDVLGLAFVSRHAGRHVFFRCGAGMLLLFDPSASIDPTSEIPTHGARGPGHVAFAIAHIELEEWAARLQLYGVAIEREVTWPNGGQSIYFRDPAGNSLEFATRDLWGL